MKPFKFIKRLGESLQGRLYLTLLSSFIAVGIFSSYMFMSAAQYYQQETTQIMHRDLAKHVAAHYTFDEKGVLNLEKIKHVFHELMILGPNFEFYVLDTKGKILAYSADKNKIKASNIPLSPIQSFIACLLYTSPSPRDRG